MRIEVMKLVSQAAGCAALLCSVASAHSPYLMPNTFDVSERDHVSVQASFTEEPFVPDVVMKSGSYHAQLPDGRSVPIEPLYTRDLAVLDVETTLPGTYRISTGTREGRSAKAAFSGVEWKFLSDRDIPQAKGKIFDIKSITRAEVYVSRGSPTDSALAPRGQGLEFQMLTHPNKLLAGGEIRFNVLFDGKPVSGESVVVLRARDDTGEARAPTNATSGKDGIVAVRLAEPGVYHLMLRYRFPLPGAEARAESHTYALTLEVAE
jgi:uncharacterized GH25 family protein